MALSLLFQVQRLAQYEQYFQSILCESHHDHTDHEHICRATAKAKQVGDIPRMLHVQSKAELCNREYRSNMGIQVCERIIEVRHATSVFVIDRYWFASAVRHDPT